MTSTDHPGDPNHPDHEAYLLELGRATYAAAGLAGIAFDVLRIHGGFDSADLYRVLLQSWGSRKIDVK